MALRANTIIAGVTKAGTTSLFVSLQTHPQVATAAVKETRYFLPARYGQPLEPAAVYESYFASAESDRPVRLEATPSYFYGGQPLIDEIVTLLGPDVRILVVLREPVSRFVSFFSFQKARLRIPEAMTVEEYLAIADRLGPSDFTDPDNERWFAFLGGCYADYLPPWQETFGPRLRVLFFDDVMSSPAALPDVARWLGIDPEAFPATELRSENRTTAPRLRGVQRVALAANDRFERFWRRHPDLKRRLRAAYYRVNGRAARDAVPEEIEAELARRYEEPNARLAAQLREAGTTDLPAWLRQELPSSDRGPALPAPVQSGACGSGERSERDQESWRQSNFTDE